METKSPVNAALKAGAYLGIIFFIINLLAYFVNYAILASFWFGIIILASFFGLILYYGFQYRKELGGYMEYGTAFNFSFLTLVVSGLIGLLGNMLLYLVIDPQLPQLLADSQLETTLNMLDRFGAGDSISGDQLDEIREGLESAYTLGGLLKSFLWSLLIYAVMALILAAIIKKKDKSLDY